MGNTIRKLSVCDCFGSLDLDCEEEMLYKTYNNEQFQTVNSMPRKSCNVFTISPPDYSYSFTTSSRNGSLTDLHASNDLIDMNLSKISKELSSSVCSLDSGYESITPTSDIDLVAINLETISLYSNSYDTVSMKAALSLDFLYTSLFNISYLVNRSFNKMIKKSGLEQKVFSSTFVATMKQKLKKKVNAPNDVDQSESVSSVNLDDIASSNIIDDADTENNYSMFSMNGLFSLRNSLFKIYDVNYF